MGVLENIIFQNWLQAAVRGFAEFLADPKSGKGFRVVVSGVLIIVDVVGHDAGVKILGYIILCQFDFDIVFIVRFPVEGGDQINVAITFSVLFQISGCFK